jgi:hypothetical protein
MCDPDAGTTRPRAISGRKELDLAPAQRVLVPAQKTYSV